MARYILFMLIASTLRAAGTGSVCVAPVAKPTTGAKSLANPSGGNKVQVYSVQIDKLASVEAATDNGVPVSGLALAERHFVKISGDGKAVSSFHFRFSDYGSSNLCLWFKPLYETWSLSDAKGRGKVCVCP